MVAYILIKPLPMEIAQVSTVAIFPSFPGSLNFDEIGLIQNRRVAKSSQFIQIGRNLHTAAELIDSKWDKLSPEEKDALRNLAYGLIEPARTTSGIFPRIWSGIYLMFIKVTGQEKSFHFCLDALDCLVDSILNAIENEQISSSTVLSDVLEKLTSSAEFGGSVDERDGRREV
jgi:hypothetical protein